MDAYEWAITATSTSWAPWFVIPADRKHVMQAMVAKILASTIEGLQLDWPVVSDEDRRANAEARKRLEGEDQAARRPPLHLDLSRNRPSVPSRFAHLTEGTHRSA